MSPRPKGSVAPGGGAAGAALAESAAAVPQPANVPCVVALVFRERARAAIRAAFPRRRARLLLVHGASELSETLRATLADAVIIDIAGGSDEADRASGLAREFPSLPFVGIAPLRGADGPALAAAVAHDFADVLTEGVDDGVLRALLAPVMFSTRFAGALWNPPPALGLGAPLQQSAWRSVIARGGRPVRTSELAASLGVTREHLSRSFASAGAPNLKRVIDLVRLLAAAELSKNPGYDVRDVARILGFASASHLSSTAQRVVGTRPASLARLRAVDLVDRFGQGRGRSRASGDKPKAGH
ncbi:MAG TPA: helix-turn-helix domain-containing protein [Gemmatimonadaceae bacterium]|nr:helix-turn-helix domain-containing protein [Gemmatimonadaceae bacterium]